MVPSLPSPRAMRPNRHTLALWAVVAGCSGPGGDAGATPTATPPPDVDAAAVAEQARAFAADVAAYNGTSTLNVTQQANNVNRTVDVHIERRVDRASNRLMLRQTSSVAGQTSEVGIWLVNETLYQRSEAFVRTFLEVGLEPERAARAAAGWGNDTLRIARSGADGVAYVWVLRWDDAANASEFEAALRASLDGRADRVGDGWRLEAIDGIATVRSPTDRTTVLLYGHRSFVGTAAVSGDNATVRVSG